MARLLLGAAALVVVAGGAARAFPGLMQGTAHQGGGGLVATIAPIVRMQDSLSRSPLGERGPLAPVGMLLSWALDLAEVALEGVGGVAWALLWPLRLLLRTLILPLLGGLSALMQNPQGAVGQLALAVTGALTWVGEAAGAYAQGLAALLAATLGVVGRYVGDALGALFNAPALQYLDAMDPARHIPTTAPALAYRAAQGIKVGRSLGQQSSRSDVVWRYDAMHTVRCHLSNHT